jgi:hypothetical protein
MNRKQIAKELIRIAKSVQSKKALTGNGLLVKDLTDAIFNVDQALGQVDIVIDGLSDSKIRTYLEKQARKLEQVAGDLERLRRKLG